VAGGGAGKTEALTRRIAYLLLVKGVEPSSIVAFTFTKKAVKSMKSGIYEQISKLKDEKATSNFGEMFVGTIHGYMKQLFWSTNSAARTLC
jgi:DNA helicase II / ATP-dependent DNA helicase PcrA